MPQQTNSLLCQTLFVTVVFILYCLYLRKGQNQLFQMSSSQIKYHSNWTDPSDHFYGIKQLKKAYRQKSIQSLQLCLAMSKLPLQDVKQFLPEQFIQYQVLIINLANNPIGTFGAHHVLSLIPNGVIYLELNFDSIAADEGLTNVLAERLNILKSVKHLKISLILAIQKEESLLRFWKSYKLNKALKSYSLVLSGNSLTIKSLRNLKSHLSKSKLLILELNFYNNYLSDEGAEIVAKSISKQRNLIKLSLDLSSNQITKDGVLVLCQGILQINSPSLTRMQLNLGSNHIGDEGAKAIGDLVSKLPSLVELHIRVASSRISLAGLQSLLQGVHKMQSLTILELSLARNQIGVDGAKLIIDLILSLSKITKLTLNLAENEIGDEGAIKISKAVTRSKHLKFVYLNFGSNQLSIKGLVKSLNIFAKEYYFDLFLGFSGIQVETSQLGLINDPLRQIILRTSSFVFELVDTLPQANRKALRTLFEQACKQSGYKATVLFNTATPDEQEKYFKTLANQKKTREGQKEQQIL